MCPSTHNMDLIRSSCLMLVIKLKEKKRWGGGGGFVHPSYAPAITSSQVVRILHAHSGQHTPLKDPSVPGTPLSDCSAPEFSLPLEEIYGRAGAQRSDATHRPGPGAPRPLLGSRTYTSADGQGIWLQAQLY